MTKRKLDTEKDNDGVADGLLFLEQGILTLLPKDDLPAYWRLEGQIKKLFDEAYDDLSGHCSAMAETTLEDALAHARQY